MGEGEGGGEKGGGGEVRGWPYCEGLGVKGLLQRKREWRKWFQFFRHKIKLSRTIILIHNIDKSDNQIIVKLISIVSFL